MAVADVVAIFLAGIAAGAINAVVGSGTLITFPVLIGLGYPPLVANMSNTVGLLPGSVSGTAGYRRELAGQSARVWRLGAAASFGAAIGAALLLTLPESGFDAVVPAFIVMALVLVIAQPRLAELLRRRETRAHGGPAIYLVITLIAIYGGYFGGAQGIVFLAALGLLVPDALQRSTALKNAIALFVTAVAAMAFVVFGVIDWSVAGLLGAGSILGGQLGSHVGRRLPDAALRAFIVVVGSSAVVKLWLG